MFKSVYGNPVNILHFPGTQKKTHVSLINELKETKFKTPGYITIVSIMTPDVVSISPLHYQLANNGVPYINTVPGNHPLWVNKQKPGYILKALERVTTEYCLVLDGNDVVIVDDLHDILYKFESYGKELIFNATSNRFPNVVLDKIPDVKEEQRILLFGGFCFLNAGCCFGRTEYMRKFYTEVAKTADASNIPSEQYHVRKVMGAHQDKVFFDYDCRIFQVFNKNVQLENKGGETK